MTERYGVESIAEWTSALQNPAVTGVVIATPAPCMLQWRRAGSRPVVTR